MSDGLIAATAGFLVTLIALVKPIINLNTNITELKISIDSFKEQIKNLESRITTHGTELDQLRTKVAEHEVRIETLERK